MEDRQGRFHVYPPTTGATYSSNWAKERDGAISKSGCASVVITLWEGWGSVGAVGGTI